MKWHIASVSWGKDSLAMLLMLIAKGYPLNEVVFYDTGMEFEAIYHTSYEQGLAQTEAGKRLCRLTKAEMLSRIGWAFGILLAFFDLRQQYDYLKATFDILRNENSSLLDTIREIEKAYDEMEADDFREYKDSTRKFERLLAALPDRAWLE